MQIAASCIVAEMILNKNAMRLLVQRAKSASVTVDGKEIGRSGPGLCLFLGVARDDSEEDVNYLAEKVVGLRIFEDDAGKFNRSLAEIDGDILLVSEFTLYGDCSKGKRPSFSRAASSVQAEELYNGFARRLEQLGIRTATGRFQAKMEVNIINDGPVTLILDSRKLNSQ